MLFLECPFEIVSPVLDLMKLLFELFGPEDFLYKKNIEYKGLTLLTDLNIYTESLYEYLVLSLKATYEAVRDQSFDILRLFPKNLEFLTISRIRTEFETALKNSKSLIIRIYESSAYMFSLLFTKHLEILNDLIKKKNKDQKLNVFEFLVELLEKQFDEFQESFLVDWEKFYNAAPHGLLTIISNVVRSLFEQENAEELVKELLNNKESREIYSGVINRLMKITGKIMMFATKISAENVSTSVFDNSSTRKINQREKFE